MRVHFLCMDIPYIDHMTKTPENQTRDGRHGAFSSGAGRGQKSAGRGEGENPRGGAGRGKRTRKSTDPKVRILLWRYL